MSDENPRIKREKKTIEKMVYVYCKGNHYTNGKQLCDDCSEFLSYAFTRLSKCPFQDEKSTCVKCLVHCYQPEMREKAKKIMRYSGPRLIYLNPILSLQHVLDGRKKPLTLKEYKKRSTEPTIN